MTRAVQRAIVTQRLLPLEAIAAATLNGAAAMDLAHEVGTLSPQRLANFILTHPLDGLIDIGYRFDENPVAAVYIRGRRLESL
jgi:imidazolonepropionase